MKCYEEYGTEELQEARNAAVALVERMRTHIAAIKTRSAWDRGVKVYALELLKELRETVRVGYEDFNSLQDEQHLIKALLDGERDWTQYSWSACSLTSSASIAKRLYCPSELKKTRNGERRPNSREEWLGVQARALQQACDSWIVPAYKYERSI